VVRLDDAAAHDAGHQRRDLPGGDADHGVVKPGQAVGELTQTDAGLPAAQASQRGQVGVAVALAQRGDLVEQRCGGGRVGLEACQRSQVERRHDGCITSPGP
jgi:hypothetical protein